MVEHGRQDEKIEGEGVRVREDGADKERGNRGLVVAMSNNAEVLGGGRGVGDNHSPISSQGPGVQGELASTWSGTDARGYLHAPVLNASPEQDIGNDLRVE